MIVKLVEYWPVVPNLSLAWPTILCVPTVAFHDTFAVVVPIATVVLSTLIIVFVTKSLLLEGDGPVVTNSAGPGCRYAVGPVVAGSQKMELDSVLPDSYGTQKIFLTARDPHWLYVAWDFSLDQIRIYNSKSLNRHLVLRVFKETFSSGAIFEINVYPESRNWFIPVTLAATKYMVELGYYSAVDRWVGIEKSQATLTPPDSIADDTTVKFVTIGSNVTVSELLPLVKVAMCEGGPLAGTLQDLHLVCEDLPSPSTVSGGVWTEAQSVALEKVVSMDQVRRVWIGSLEVTELIQRQLNQQVSSYLGGVSSGIGGVSSGVGFSSMSSPFGGFEFEKAFWFNVNAELIIYGSTDPDAEVSIGGRKIKLRGDGSFSFRFLLPNGDYVLPVVAISSDGSDLRCATLRFNRDTAYRGVVGEHFQDPTLKAPVVDSIVENHI